MTGLRLVQIHPKAAERAGVRDGDEIVVESPRGSITATAQVWEGIREDTISVPNGFGPAEIRSVVGRMEQTRLAEVSAEQLRSCQELRAYQEALRRTADAVRDLQRSWTWRVGRAVVGPVAWVLRGLGLIGRRPPECGSQNAER
jgi:predicted molibdopterin-dependent oxidoreductase YjgC